MGLGDNVKAGKLKYDAKKLVKKGDYDAAFELYQKALQVKDTDVEAMVEFSKLKIMMRDYDGALDMLMEARDIPSDEDEFGVFNHEYWYALGECYDKLRRCGEMVDAYEEGLRLEHVPCSKGINYENVYFRLGVNYKEIKDWENAVHYFDKVTNPTFLAMRRGDILCEMEECYREMGDDEAADGCMREAMDNPPIRKDYVAMVAWFSWCMNSYQGESFALREGGPVEQLKSCLEKDKKNSKTWSRIGRIYMELGMLKEADEHMRHAAAYDQDNPAIWRTLSELYASMGDEDRSLKALQRASELGDYANRSSALLEMASFLKSKGLEADAASCYERLDPNDPKAIMHRNELLQKAAVRIQRVFRGNQVRKKLKRVSRRVVVRNYGTRAPLRNHNAGKVQKMGAYKSQFELRIK